MNLALSSRFKFAQLKTQKHKEWNRLLLVANLAEKHSRNLGSAGIKANSPALNMMGARNVHTVLLDTLEMANASVSLAQKDAKNPKADEIKTFFQQSHHNISTLYKDWQELYSTVYMDWYSLSEAQRLKIQTIKDPQSVKERKRIQLVLSQLSSIQQDITEQFSQWSIVFFGNNLPGAQQVIDFTLDLLKNTQGGKLPIGGDGDENGGGNAKTDAETSIQQLILTDDLEVQVLKLKLINEGYDEYDLDNTMTPKPSVITSRQQQTQKYRQQQQTSDHLFKTKAGRTISEIENTSGNFRRELISGQPHEGKGDDESRALVLSRSLLGVEEDEKEKEKRDDGGDKRVARVGQREERVAKVGQQEDRIERVEQREERVERVEETKSKPKKSKSSLFSLKNLSGLAGLGLKTTALVATVKTVLVVSAASNAAILGVHNILKVFGYNIGWIDLYQSLLLGTANKAMAVGNFLAYNGLYSAEVNPALAEPSIDRSMLAETQSAMNRTLFMISILRSTLVVGRVAKQWADQAAFRYEEKERQMYNPLGDEKEDQDDQKDETGQVKEKKQKRNFLSKMARAWNRMNGVKINVPWLLYACGIGSVAGSYILDYVNGTAYQTFVPLSDLIPAKGVKETVLGLLKKAMGLWGEPPGKVDYIGEYVNIPWNMGIFMEFWNQLRDLNPGLYYTGLLTGAAMEVLLVTIGGKILENLLNEYIVKPGKWKGLTDASNYRMQARCLLAVTRTVWNLSPFAFMASVMNLVGISMESSIELPTHKLDFVFDTTFASTNTANAKKIFVPSDSAIDILADRYPSDKEFVLKMSKWFATHLLLSFTSTAVQTVIEVAENFRPLSDDEKAQLILDAAKQLDSVRDLARLAAVAKLTTTQKEIVHELELMGVDATISQQKQSLLKLKQTGVADSTIRYLAKSSPLLVKLNQQRIAGGGGDESIAGLLEESKDEKETTTTRTKAIENVRQVGDERTAIQTPEQKLIECAPYLDMANRLQNPKTIKLNQEKREGVLSRLQQLLPFGGGMSDFKEAANELTREENSKIKAQTTALAVAAVQADPAQMQQFIAKGNKAVDISASIMRQLQKNIKYEEPDERKEEKKVPDKQDDENENDKEGQDEEEREADDEPEVEVEDESDETQYRDESLRSEQNSILNDEDEVA